MTEPQNIPVNDEDAKAEQPADAPANGSAPAAEPQAPAEPMPTPDQLKVKDSKTYGITGMQKEVLSNYLAIQNLNQFQLRSYLQLLAESQWGIKADQFVRFGLDLDQNKITVEFLEPINKTEPAAGQAPGLEAAPPASAQ